MRSVPHLIDSSSKIGEACMVFMIPLFILRTIHPIFALLSAVMIAIFYVKWTFGQPDGTLIHGLYRLGLPLSGLLPVKYTEYHP